jgi:hypothetical protein
MQELKKLMTPPVPKPVLYLVHFCDQCYLSTWDGKSSRDDLRPYYRSGNSELCERGPTRFDTVEEAYKSVRLDGDHFEIKERVKV